jgi:acyl transferase domain-containing protein
MQAFGISPAEALLIDPQQRLIAEVVHEALAMSPLPPLGASAPPPLNATGVYVGVASSDYGSLVASYSGRAGAFHATSNAISVVAGRLSFMFGMIGVWHGYQYMTKQHHKAIHIYIFIYGTVNKISCCVETFL